MVTAKDATRDLVAIVPLRDFTCVTCGDTGWLLVMEDAGPHCLTCVDLDHLVFLPAGDGALSRRARRESTLSAIVVKFSRSRKRYERQGILVEPQALELAEQQCLGDEDARRRRRERDRLRREVEDVAFQARMAAEIVRLFPGCPKRRAERIALHSQSTSPRVFELFSGKEKQIPFKGQTTWFLTQVDYSPDPTRPWIAAGNSGGGVEMLNVTTGDLRWVSHTGDSVSDVRFSSDGSSVATASLDGTVRLFDADSGRELRSIHHPRPVTSVAFTTDGAHLATFAEDRRLRIWSTHGSDNGPVTDFAVPVRVNSLAFSPDSSSKFLAVAGSDWTTMVFQWQKLLKPLATLRQHTASVNTVAFDPKQSAEGSPRLMSASDDGTVALYSCDQCGIGDDQLERYAMEQIGSR